MEAIDFLKNYSGPKLNIMEICGSHTKAFSNSGIRNILPENIKLISGPGCPVCVTPGGYIDKLIELGLSGKTIVTFGDMLKVPGSKLSLSEARARGVKTMMVMSPLDLIDIAAKNPDEEYVFAAVGFETTAPVYAVLITELMDRGIANVKLLTAIKTMPGAIKWLLADNSNIDAFIAPGHVCAVVGLKEYDSISKEYRVPFAVLGFEPEELVLGLANLIKNINNSKVYNYYDRAVSDVGNEGLMSLLYEIFEPCDANWRGMGNIARTGLRLKNKYLQYDAGSKEFYADVAKFSGCRCDEVVTGKIKPTECPLFGKSCTPLEPKGACMVSDEGSCNAFYELG